MNTKNKYLIKLIDLIYDKHQNLLPFLDVFRKDIRDISFLDLDDSVTAVIILKDKKFEILFNLNFIKEYSLTDEDILWIICHEIGHYILNHLTSEYNNTHSKQFCNIAFDCQVNSMLYNINEQNPIDTLNKFNQVNYDQYISGEDRNGYFFLLVPPFKNTNEIKYDFNKAGIPLEKTALIIEFWFKNYSKEGLGLDDIVFYLEQLIEEDEHDDEPEDREYKEVEIDELPESVTELSETLIQNIKDNDAESISELSNDLFDLSNIEIKSRDKQTLERAIEKTLFKKKCGKEGEISEVYYRNIFPAITRKESLYFSNDLIPVFYENKNTETIASETAVYIDFSISTEPYHKQICKSITSLRKAYKGPYYGFTESVEELSYQDLLSGNFEVSGTEIDPVIEHINKNKFKKALIITDGEFDKSRLKTKAELYIILFENTNSISSIRSAGKVKQVWFLE
ncbi:MAG: hypothetical protein K8F60_03845 [Melioribacteraceae bacterium]|nr:hypothetical protein [Melioribacteraceae bacterium]